MVKSFKRAFHPCPTTLSKNLSTGSDTEASRKSFPLSYHSEAVWLGIWEIRRVLEDHKGFLREKLKFEPTKETNYVGRLIHEWLTDW